MRPRAGTVLESRAGGMGRVGDRGARRDRRG